MTKYVRVKESPAEVAKEEYVIKMPDYREEIRTCKTRISNDRLVASHYLRALAQHIGVKYDPKFDAYRDMTVHNYRGVHLADDAAVSTFILKVFADQYPQMTDAYLDFKIKNRPFGTKLIYFVGPHQATSPFTANGIDELSEKDIDKYMERKPKKFFEKNAPAADADKGKSEV